MLRSKCVMLLFLSFNFLCNFANSANLPTDLRKIKILGEVARCDLSSVLRAEAQSHRIKNGYDEYTSFVVNQSYVVGSYAEFVLTKIKSLRETKILVEANRYGDILSKVWKHTYDSKDYNREYGFDRLTLSIVCKQDKNGLSCVKICSHIDVKPIVEGQ